MNTRRMIALLCAILMLLTLTACSGESDNSAKENSEPPVSEDAKGYQALISAIEAVYNDADATSGDMMTASYGEKISNVMMAFFDSMQEVDAEGQQDLSDINLLLLGSPYQKGSKVKLTISGETQLTQEALEECQAKAKSVGDKMAMLSDYSQLYDAMTDEELAEAEMTRDDVSKIQNYISKLEELGAIYSNSEITDGYNLNITADVDGETQDIEVLVLCVDGSWILGDYADIIV